MALITEPLSSCPGMVQLGDHFDFVGLCVGGEGAGEGLPVPLTLIGIRHCPHFTREQL